MRINTETVKFIYDFNQLAKKSKKGIRPFSKATDWDAQLHFLLYDDESPKELEENMISYPLISGCLIDELHHDIISTWTEDYAFAKNELDFVVVLEEDNDPYVCIKSIEDESFYIIIENGQWYLL